MLLHIAEAESTNNVSLEVSKAHTFFRLKLVKVDLFGGSLGSVLSFKSLFI